MTWRDRVAAAGALLVTAGLVACSAPGGTSAPPQGRAAQIQTSAPPTLPDISKLVPTVQAQIRAQFDVLNRTLENGASTVIDRANAYGELAKLLMAAQLPDAAEADFNQAQSLDPSDYRWPYYLANLARSKGDLPKASGLFERVLQLKPDDMDSLVWLGDVSLAAGRVDAAEPAFARAAARSELGLRAVRRRAHGPREGRSSQGGRTSRRGPAVEPQGHGCALSVVAGVRGAG